METPTSTAPITRLAKRHADLAVMNEEMFYDESENDVKENEKATIPSPLTWWSPALSALSKYVEKKVSK